MAASKVKIALMRHATMGQTPPPLPVAGQGGGGGGGFNQPPMQAQQGVAMSPATQGGPTHGNVRKSSDQRFRSFAERYVVARAHMLTNDPQRLAEEQYSMVLDAKRFYAMIERAGQNIQPEDGVF